MKKYLNLIITTGLTIFAMLFGASNLMFPLKSGIISGNQLIVGLCGFLTSGALIPLAGLIAIMFFDGDYKTFFYRLGKIPGAALIFACMLIIGPLLVMPRIIAFSYEMIRPFIENYVSLKLFTGIFSILTFVCCYKKNSIIDLIGKILSPLILVSLCVIFGVGMWTRGVPVEVTSSSLEIFKENFLLGYHTLDLLGTIFFGYIVLSILRTTEKEYTKKNLAHIMLLSSLVGISLLSIVYIGLGYLAAWHGQEFANLDLGKIFINLVLKIVGSNGALLISSTVFLACLTTIIALASVASEYLRTEIADKKISYVSALIAVLALSGILAQFELGTILKYSAPFIYILYPALITLTFCNLGFKLFHFKPVKLPVLLVFLLSTAYYGPDIINNIQEITQR